MKRPSSTEISTQQAKGPCHQEPRSRESPSLEVTTQLESKDIFERSVQEQAALTTSLSRRSSFNEQSTHSTSPNLSMSPVNIPTHLSSEAFIPTCLDATTEMLTDDNTNLEKVEVIQTTAPHIADVLNQTYNTTSSKSKKKLATSPLLKRRHTFNNLANLSCAPILLNLDLPEPATESLARSNSSTSNYYVDYSDRKKLNFCSFADLLTDELLQKSDQAPNQSSFCSDPANSDGKSLASTGLKTPCLEYPPASPISRRNSRIYVAPAMIQTNVR